MAELKVSITQKAFSSICEHILFSERLFRSREGIIRRNHGFASLLFVASGKMPGNTRFEDRLLAGTVHALAVKGFS